MLQNTFGWRLFSSALPPRFSVKIELFFCYKSLVGPTQWNNTRNIVFLVHIVFLFQTADLRKRVWFGVSMNIEQWTPIFFSYLLNSFRIVWINRIIAIIILDNIYDPKHRSFLVSLVYFVGNLHRLPP